MNVINPESIPGDSREQERERINSNLFDLYIANFKARIEKDNKSADNTKKVMKQFLETSNVNAQRKVLSGIKEDVNGISPSEDFAKNINIYAAEIVKSLWEDDIKHLGKTESYKQIADQIKELCKKSLNNKENVNERAEAFKQIIVVYEDVRLGLFNEFFKYYNKLVKEKNKDEVNEALKKLTFKSGGKDYLLGVSVENESIKSPDNKVWRISEALSRLHQISQVHDGYKALETLGFEEDQVFEEVELSNVKNKQREMIRFCHVDTVESRLNDLSNYVNLSDEKKEMLNVLLGKMSLNDEELRKLKSGDVSDELKSKFKNSLNKVTEEINKAYELVDNKEKLKELKELEELPYVHNFFFESDEEDDIQPSIASEPSSQSEVTSTSFAPSQTSSNATTASTSLGLAVPSVPTSEVAPSSKLASPEPTSAAVPEVQKSREELIAEKSTEIKSWLTDGKVIALPSQGEQVDGRVKNWPANTDLNSKIIAYILGQSGKFRNLKFVKRGGVLEDNQKSLMGERNSLSEIEMLKVLNEAVENDLKTDPKKQAVQGLIEFAQIKDDGELGESKDYPNFANIWESIRYDKIGNSFKAREFNPIETNLDNIENLSRLNENGIIVSVNIDKYSGENKEIFNRFLSEYVKNSGRVPGDKLNEVQDILDANASEFKDVFLDKRGARGNFLMVKTRDLREEWKKRQESVEGDDKEKVEHILNWKQREQAANLEYINESNIVEHIGRNNLNYIKSSINNLKIDLEKIDWSGNSDPAFKDGLIKNEIRRVIRAALKKIRVDKKDDSEFIARLTTVVYEIAE